MVLFSVAVILVAFTALTPPNNPVVTDGEDQLYKVPFGTIPFTKLVGLTVKETPLQVVVVISVTEATGLMVAVTVNTAPIQLSEIVLTK